MAGVAIIVYAGGNQRLAQVFGHIGPAGKTDSAQILSLKAQKAAAHLGRVGRNKQVRNPRLQHRLERAQIPGVGDDIVQVMVRVELPILIDDVRRAFDVGNQQLRTLRQRRCDPSMVRYQAVGVFLATWRPAI